MFPFVHPFPTHYPLLPLSAKISDPVAPVSHKDNASDAVDEDSDEDEDSDDEYDWIGDSSDDEGDDDGDGGAIDDESPNSTKRKEEQSSSAPKKKLKIVHHGQNYPPIMSAKISAVPNVGNTCYLLQTFYVLFLIGGWKERESEASDADSKGLKIGRLALQLLRSMEHGSENEASPTRLVRKLVYSLFRSKSKLQQDVLETFLLVSDHLDGTRLHEFQTQTWVTCACGLNTEKHPEIQSVLVVSTDKPAVNLEELVNTVLQRNEDGWKCPSLECMRSTETTSLSTTNWFKKISSCLSRDRLTSRAHIYKCLR